MSISRIGIVNRGDPALRFLAALTALRHADPSAPDGAALYIDPDAEALFVRRAPHAVRIGADRAAYLDAATVLAGLREAGCDAAWLGWGFASEDAAFAGALEDAGITLLAPRAETMRALGDKIRAKQTAERLGVPIAPWAIADSLEAARAAGERIGYPVLLKAAGGGGGRGIRRVDAPEQLADALAAVQGEAARSFGGGGVLIERLVTEARHIEVQFLGDGAGGVITVGVRDCSVQRRRQKVIEECPALGLDPSAVARLEAATRTLGSALKYRSAGTAEFLWDTARDAPCFLEVNTRLQVEHTITEAVYGVDLVRAQIALARGAALPTVGPARGWAIEARIYAEDTRNDFTPAPGRLARLALPTGPGIRVDPGYAEGEVLSAQFDPLIAKVIASGPDRPTALGRLAAALEGTRIVVDGGQTNVAFLRDLLDRPALRAGAVDIGWVDRLRPPPPPGAAAAVIAAAIDRFMAEGDHAGAGDDRHQIEVGQPLAVYRTGLECFRLVGRGGALTARWRPRDRLHAQVEVDRRIHSVERAPGDTIYIVDGTPHRVAAAARGAVTSPSMALVLSIAVQPGATVAAGDLLLVLESMKMEVRVTAPTAGEVAAVRVQVGDQVRTGQVLLRVAAAEEDAAPSGPALPWEAAPPSPERAAVRLTAAVIGWDIEPGRFESDLAGLDGAGCLKLLSAFADIAELFEGRGQVGRPVTPRLLLDTLRRQGPDALTARMRSRLRRALGHHGIDDLTPSDRLADALRRIERAGANRRSTVRAAVAALAALDPAPRRLLDRLAHLDPDRFGPVCDAASRARYHQYERPAIERAAPSHDPSALLARLQADPPDWDAVRRATVSELSALARAAAEGWPRAAEAIARRLEFGVLPIEPFQVGDVTAIRLGKGGDARLLVCCAARDLASVLADLRAEPPCLRLTVVIPDEPDLDGLLAELDLGGRQPFAELCLVHPQPLVVRRVDPLGRPLPRLAEVLPAGVRRFDLRRLERFAIERLPADDGVLLLLAQAVDNPDDRRLLAYASVRDLRPRRGRRLSLPTLDRQFHSAVRAIEAARDAHDPRGRMQWNRLTLSIDPVLPLGLEVVRRYVLRLAPAAERIGLEKVVVRARFADPGASGGVGPLMDLSIYNVSGQRLELVCKPASERPLMPRTVYESRVVAARRRGQAYPYEIIRLLETGGTLRPGAFVEHDVDTAGAIVAVPDRAPAQAEAAVIFGVFEQRGATPCTRVLLLSDPTRRMGALSEPECRRVDAAITLAAERGVPLEWIAVSAGARIDWDTGTENLDWTAQVLRRIVEFTQQGGEINIVVPGICVGAQAYWNAMATMLMHTSGLLVMTDRGAMVLTGKRALDASGCVSAEDDLALGGYAAIMGPNGQAQARASDLGEALRLMQRFYRLTWRAPGAARPPHLPTRDRVERDVSGSPYPAALDHGFETVGELFGPANAERKRPFAVRPVMAALIDRDHKPLERWSGWREAETAVVWEARIGGYAAQVIGIDNQPHPRLGPVSSAGPSVLSGGTLFPQSARKIARALNAASGRRPVVILANLSGFDGSPESLARWQLEYGAEIGRAVVNFAGPIVFVVLSRYHGGAYVVFSKRLNPRLCAVALRGSYASVIGGVPAAKVVFARQAAQEAERDGVPLTDAINGLARRFDGVHSVQRALDVGSIDGILEAADLRPFVIRRLAADHAAANRSAAEETPA